ncbi:hypothetical protein NEOC65_001747 [Neochlamydia sp. AcF65]|nr:hypothetical protein [Neochlamydia sp. AcF65]MBS4170232.1 hypothetical protein [Neochlamydia sp. AcF95]
MYCKTAGLRSFSYGGWLFSFPFSKSCFTWQDLKKKADQAVMGQFTNLK